MNKAPSMKSANARILTINGGSSSIKFALFEAGDSLRRILEGGIERIGLPKATFRVKGLNAADDLSRSVTALDHTQAVGALDLQDAVDVPLDVGAVAVREGGDFSSGQHRGQCPHHSTGDGADDVIERRGVLLFGLDLAPRACFP